MEERKKLEGVAKNIFERKYAKEGEEIWEKLAWRVAFDTARENLEDARIFYKYINEMYFIPGGRILANAGTKVPNRANCFFLELQDSREDIYETLKNASEIFAWGGGLGIEVSNLRERGAEIKSTGGRSSGPVSFLELFNLTGDVIQQASRRAAMIAVLDISHPDIFEFINYKSTPNRFTKQILEEYENNRKLAGRPNGTFDLLKKTLVDKQLLHFNISVSISDEFMEAVEEDDYWNLISPATGEVIQKIRARDLLDEIAEHIWMNGDPGIIFTGEVKKDNMVPYVSEKLGPNPCSEIFLLDGESCVLGSINLHKMYDGKGGIDYELLENTIRVGVKFLDNIHDITENKVEKINETSKSLRRIGLGVMGWADLLAELEIGYGTEYGLELGNYLSWFINMIAWDESKKLAEERGPFKKFNKDEVDFRVIEKVYTSEYLRDVKFDLSPGNFKVRNVSVTALAPTGSISLVANVNSSIEPFFALAYKRYLTEGESNIAKETFMMMNPILEDKLIKYGYSEEQIDIIKDYIVDNGSLQECDLVDEKIKEIFVTSHDIPPLKHIEMQAKWQEFISNAISKTINVPRDFTKKQIYEVIRELWKAKVKSSTIYRDGSRFFQILNLGH